MTCKKCNSANLIIRPNAKNPDATELICSDCGAWQKFVGKDEKRYYEIKLAGHKIELIKKGELLEVLEEIQSTTHMSTCMNKDECNGKREMLSRIIHLVENMPLINEKGKPIK